MKSPEEIELLKSQWTRDACWDIENTEGFEDYREELLQYRHEKEALWQEARELHHDELASKLCPMSFASSGEFENYRCVVEKCAWWSEVEDCCVIRALNLRN